MSNRTRAKRARAVPAAQVSDFGAAPHRVVVEDVADPDNPNRTIRRARRWPQYHTLWRRGGLTDAEHEAADRYATTCEALTGARERGDAGMPCRRDPWDRGHSTMTQMQASDSLRGAHEALGPSAVALLTLYVVEDLTVTEVIQRLYVRDDTPAAEIARRRRENERACLGRIRGALTRLAEHWGME